MRARQAPPGCGGEQDVSATDSPSFRNPGLEATGVLQFRGSAPPAVVEPEPLFRRRPDLAFDEGGDAGGERLHLRSSGGRLATSSGSEKTSL